MENKVRPTIEQHFGDLIDPRIDRTKLHKPINIPVIAHPFARHIYSGACLFILGTFPSLLFLLDDGGKFYLVDFGALRTLLFGSLVMLCARKIGN